MNERIKELAQQCYDPGDVLTSFEKFAELIVKECAVPMITQARAMDADGRYQNNPIEVNTMHLHQGLLKHFGVEE